MIIRISIDRAGKDIWGTSIVASSSIPYRDNKQINFTVVVTGKSVRSIVRQTRKRLIELYELENIKPPKFRITTHEQSY